MRSFLTDVQQSRQREFREFVARHIAPAAGDWDRAQKIPEAVVNLVAEVGYLGGALPVKYGGQGWDTVTFGLLNEAFGRGSASLTDLLTVQAMVSMTLLKWGSAEQKSRWLPALASGETIGAFALTEPGGGSDLQSLQTQFTETGDCALNRLNGQKTWISYGQTAGLFLTSFGHAGHSYAPRLPGSTRRSRPAGRRSSRSPSLLGYPRRGPRSPHLFGRGDSRRQPRGKTGRGFGVSRADRVAIRAHQHGPLRIGSVARLLRRVHRSRRHSQSGNWRGGRIRNGPLHDRPHGRRSCKPPLCCALAACRAADESLAGSLSPRRSWQPNISPRRAAARAAADAVPDLRRRRAATKTRPCPAYYRDAKILELIEGSTQIHEELLGRTFIDAASSQSAN